MKIKRQILNWLCLSVCAVQWACSPQLISVGLSTLEPHFDSDAFITADGTRLSLRTWTTTESPHATFLALHGFNDYSNAFANPGSYWSDRGILVYAYDQRGFGASEHAGLWPGVNILVEDLSQAVHVIERIHPDLPLYLIGESMGGGVVMTAIARDQVRVHGIVLVAPAVWGRRTMNPFYPPTLWLGAHIVPWIKFSGQGLGITPSDNTEMLIALGKDPLVIKKTRINSIYGMVNLMDTALAAGPSIRTPTLILYGARDEIIPKAATAKMLNALSGPHRVVIYPKGYHMLLRDLNAEMVLGDIWAWINKPGGKLPSGSNEKWQTFFEE